MDSTDIQRELKRGTAELIILALIEDQPRHGYDIGRLIEDRSEGQITYHVASLYPTLYKLEDQGLIEGRWVESDGQRRRRYYRLTPKGRLALRKQRQVWRTFFNALDRVAKVTP
jgi:transcriptional regulator